MRRAGRRARSAPGPPRRILPSAAASGSRGPAIGASGPVSRGCRELRAHPAAAARVAAAPCTAPTSASIASWSAPRHLAVAGTRPHRLRTAGNAARKSRNRATATAAGATAPAPQWRELEQHAAELRVERASRRLDCAPRMSRRPRNAGGTPARNAGGVPPGTVVRAACAFSRKRKSSGRWPRSARGRPRVPARRSRDRRRRHAAAAMARIGGETGARQPRLGMLAVVDRPHPAGEPQLEVPKAARAAAAAPAPRAPDPSKGPARWLRRPCTAATRSGGAPLPVQRRWARVARAEQVGQPRAAGYSSSAAPAIAVAPRPRGRSNACRASAPDHPGALFQVMVSAAARRDPGAR